MHKIIPLLAAALAAPLTATLVAPSTAQATTPRRPGLLVTAGHATPGAQVRLYAWPPAADHLQPGQRVPRKLLGTATASASGHYALRASPAALSAAALRSGFVNLEADSGNASWFFVWRTSHAAGQTMTAASRAAPATINLPGRPDQCGPWVFRRQLKASWAIVGQSYVLRRATRVRQGFTYSGGQSSSLGGRVLGHRKVRELPRRRDGIAVGRDDVWISELRVGKKPVVSDSVPGRQVSEGLPGRNGRQVSLSRPV